MIFDIHASRIAPQPRVKAGTARRVLLGVLMAGMLMPAVHAKPLYPKAKPGREVKDLHYGDVLFYFFQDNYFEAITRFEAARQMGRADPHREDGELLLGGMLLSYGMHQDAADIFQRLLDQNVAPTDAKGRPLKKGKDQYQGITPEVRDRAWYYLALIAHRRGADDEALTAFDHIKGILPAPLEDQRQMLHAQILMSLGRDSDAATLLGNWKAPKDWINYARYNRGIALIRAGAVEDGQKLLADTGSVPLKDLNAEQLALRDRANLALGYQQLRAGHADQARVAFLRVRMEGPYSNKALLGLGWIESAIGHDDEALVAFQELNKRDIHDPAVEEALLALPYTLSRLQVPGQAAQAYEQAIAAFDSEDQRLSHSIEQIRAGQLLNVLLKDDVLGPVTTPVNEAAPNEAITALGLHGDDRPGPMGIDWRLLKLPHAADGNDADQRDLITVLASHRFQEGLKNFRDLRYLQANLRQWSQDINAFSDMLATQKQAYAQREPKVEAALKQIDLDAVLHQRDTLKAQLAQVQANQDSVGLATTTELNQWRKLEAIGATLANQSDDPNLEQARDQQRLLKGVMKWNLDHDYNLRLWQAQRAVDSLDESVAQAQQGRQSLDEAQRDEPQRIADFQAQVDTQRPRIDALLAQTDQLLAQQRSALDTMAIEVLEAYQQRLHGYAIEAQFAIAQVYDRAAYGPAPIKPENKPENKPELKPDAAPTAPAAAGGKP